MPPPHSPTPVSAWRLAAALEGVDAALRRIHAEIAEATRLARPLCLASGRCCRFEAFGHRLYTTGLEAAWFLRRLGREPTSAELDAALARGDCPYLVEGLCSVHAIRPFACRTFYCDPASEAWQTALHERCHTKVRRLHEEFGAPYRYGEWREILGLFAMEGA